MNLVVVSYNVLAARHLVPGRYPLSPVESLVSGPRFHRIGELIASLRADLVCLQEVEHKSFDLLSRRLSGLGYEGFHALRSPTVGKAALFTRNPAPCAFMVGVAATLPIPLSRKELPIVSRNSPSLRLRDKALSWQIPTSSGILPPLRP